MSTPDLAALARQAEIARPKFGPIQRAMSKSAVDLSELKKGQPNAFMENFKTLRKTYPMPFAAADKGRSDRGAAQHRSSERGAEQNAAVKASATEVALDHLGPDMMNSYGNSLEEAARKGRRVIMEAAKPEVVKRGGMAVLGNVARSSVSLTAAALVAVPVATTFFDAGKDMITDATRPRRDDEKRS